MALPVDDVPESPAVAVAAVTRPDQPEIVEFPAAGGWRVAAASRTGSRRDVNEDRWLVVPAAGARPALLAVADGVGGGAAGDRASAAAVEALEAVWREWGIAAGAPEPGPDETRTRLLAAAAAAHRSVQRLVESAAMYRSAGTTLVAAVPAAGSLVLAHAGDSRAYLVHDGVARQLTADHTWVAEQVAAGALAPGEVARHPMRNVITRYLGQPGPCEFDTALVPLPPNAWFLLCTDGVSNVVGAEELANHHSPHCGELVHHIMAATVAREGGDDATLVIACPAEAPPIDPFGLGQIDRAERRGQARRRLLVRAGLGVLGAGAAGAVVAGLWTVPRLVSDALAQYQTPPLPAAEAYLAAWNEGQFGALYDHLSQEAQAEFGREAFVSRHEAIGAEMTLTALKVTPARDGPAPQPGSGEASIPFDAVYTTARFGELRRRNQLPLVWQRGRWRVAWQPSVILPELTAGRLVRAFSESTVRGSILDRHGRPLATSPITAPFPSPTAPGSRLYPQGTVAGTVVGYVGEAGAEEAAALAKAGYLPGDVLGKSGVEAAAEALLAGQRGGRLTVLTPNGEIATTLGALPARPGEHVQLALDLDVQRVAEAALGDRAGSVVVIDPRDGSVRALAAFPRYDPSVFISQQGVAALLSDPGQPLLNRPAQGQYPAGSTFKAVTMGAALESGLFEPGSQFTCTGRWTGLPGLTFACWNTAGHGRLDLVSGLTQSCNSVFYEVGRRLDEWNADFLPAFARSCGFGTPTGALPGQESSGVVPSPAWKRQALNDGWARGDAVNMAIGQGNLLVTPLQLATLYAAIASGGQLPGPRLLDKAFLPGGNVERLLSSPSASSTPSAGGPAPGGTPGPGGPAGSGSATGRRLPWSAATLDAVRAGLRGVIGGPQGTAAHIFLGSPLASAAAGKTGTAESGGGRPSHAWFAGYAPVDAPTTVVLVMLEHGGEGSSAAAPVARRILEAVLAV
jgi:penicillin-binding protein 2